MNRTSNNNEIGHEIGQKIEQEIGQKFGQKIAQEISHEIGQLKRTSNRTGEIKSDITLQPRPQGFSKPWGRG